MSDDIEDIDDRLDPAVEPKSAKAWLAAITKAEKAFTDYQTRADNIDKLYASLRRLSDMSRDREFQMFWANIQVLGPSVYARPPVPVVVPKFKDRRPLYRIASELLERCSVVTFDINDINSIMLLLRDDLNIQARGAAWVRYETKADGTYNTEKVCIEHLDRKDFLHEPARNWLEVGWAARRAWMTRKEMRKRFSKTSGNAYQTADFDIRKEDKDNGAASDTLQAGVWEIWSKTQNKVVWVAEGVDVLLDEGEPHLKLENFYPCPKPAYGTVQRRSLIPVPDMVYYKDQLEEINELTGRIHALSSAVQVRGFYPAGAGEIGDAIEAALKSNDNRQVMVPISNWAAFGGGSAKDTIVWLPIEMIVNTIAQLVELRRQVIDDVYQIMGLSDIMRGTTDAQETLGAQEIKAQFGSVRIRDKQQELVRIARDLVRISAEITAENFDPETMLAMAQMEIPTDADIQQQIEQLTAQAEQTLQQQIEQAQNPEQARALVEQAQQQIVAELQPQVEKLEQTPTVERVVAFLRDQRIRPYVLDIETDSTIQPDENAEKQNRAEFLQAMGTAIAQLGALVQSEPAAGPFAAQVLKFALAPYRAGRELEGAVDEFAEALSQKAQQPQPNPEAEKAKAEIEMKQADQQAKAQQMLVDQQAKTEDAKRQAQLADQKAKNEAEALQRETDAKIAVTAAQAERDAKRSELEVTKINEERAMRREAHEFDMEAKRLQASITVVSAEQKAEQSDRSFEQQSQLAAQKAAQPVGK